MLVHRLRTCPSCGAPAPEELPLGDGHVLSRCTRCETVFAPAYADPDEIYQEGYLSGEVAKFGLDISHPLFQAYLFAISRRRMEIVARALGAGRTGSVLDVGCGAGEFLAVARERGWDAHGLDPVPDAAAHAREAHGLDVVTATLEEYGAPEPRFDLLSALHVLEHVADVHGFLRSLAAWGRPGGYVLIEVPNFASTARKRRLANWSGLRPLEHVTHFTPRTLARAFRRAGLTPVHIETPTYVGPPQELSVALTDLELTGPVWHAALRRTCRPGVRDGLPTEEPTAVTWAMLRGVERARAVRGAGVVVVGIARI